MGSLDAYNLIHCGKMMMALNEQRESKERSDFAIMVGDEKIQAHRNVLSAGSDFFRAMLSHDNVESSTGIVAIKQVQYSSVKACINYIYTGNFSNPDREEREQLMFTTHILQLQGMCDKIAISLKEELSPESFYSTKMIANTFNCTGLVENCNKYALENFQSIVAEDYFKHLDKDYVSFLVGSKEVNASEAVKCKTLIIWTNFDLETRASKFAELYDQVQSINGFIYCIGGSNGGHMSNAMKFNPSDSTWTKLPSMPTDEMVQQQLGRLNGKIYVMGGHGGIHYSNIVECFDTVAETWTTVARLIIQEDFSKPVLLKERYLTLEGFIYSIGGFNGERTSKAVKFNPSDSTWTTLSLMPTARCAAAAVELDGKICVMIAKTWTTVARLTIQDQHSKPALLKKRYLLLEATIREYKSAMVERFDSHIPT
uniref:kelch-like protein 18 n=1 Tax=Styela clava TaxID=7725 RepID=UPI00193A1E63|nr:kelch-like protein 18 [Styela clava]